MRQEQALGPGAFCILSFVLLPLEPPQQHQHSGNNPMLF